MRVLGLDIGDRRTGVALSDETGLLASSLPALVSDGSTDMIQSIINLVNETGASEVVVGMPISFSGERGKQAKQVDGLLSILRDQITIPIKTLDERYTTKDAERILKLIGAKPSRNRARTDSVAAAIILQAYLDSKKIE